MQAGKDLVFRLPLLSAAAVVVSLVESYAYYPVRISSSIVRPAKYILLIDCVMYRE